ncbi:MAG: AAA family ATPase, partial [Chitinophagaceae bacterium]
KEEERKIIQMQVNQLEMPTVQPIITAETISYWRKLVQAVYMDEKIEQYIVDIIFATRFPQNSGLAAIASFISYGGSPRASINLALAAKAYAFLQGRGYVVPDDIKAIAADVLRHRIGLTYEAEAADMSADKIVARILNTIAVP